METEKSSNNGFRKRAEARVKELADPLSELSKEKVKTLVHELQVHQVELAMQNEELREAQYHLEEVRDQYTDLFDFAPVGYLILSNKGII